MLKSAIIIFSLFLITTKCSVLVPCPEPCLACAQSGSCLACKPQYLLYQDDAGTACLIGDLGSVVQGCALYSKQRNNSVQCAKCQISRALVDGRCVLREKICSKVDELGQCVQCEPNYELVGNQCLSTKINACPVGHFPHLKHCKKYPPTNCLLNKEQSCQKCTAGSILIHGTCLPQQFKTVSISKSTKLCPKNSIKLSDTTCLALPLQKLPQFCMQTLNGVHCSICAYPYTPIDGICFLPVKVDDVNCNVYDSRSGKCTGCNRAYVLNRDSFCVRVFQFVENQQSNDDNWKNGKGSKQNKQNKKQNRGSICESGKGELFFQSWQGSCYYKDRNCDKIDAKTYQCTWCIEGYVLRAGKCERKQKCILRDSKNICSQCIPEYWLHPTKQTCQQKPPNCLTPSPNSSQCLACTPPFLLTNLSPTGSAVCAMLLPFCSKYNKYGTCIECNETHYLSTRGCQQRATYCLYAHTGEPGLCMICIQGYHLQDHRCYPNIKDCVRYLSNGSCVQCVTDYMVINDKCNYIDKHCRQVEDGRCVRCGDGLVAVGSACVYYEPFCKIYGADKLCNSTYAGFSIRHDVSSQLKQQYRLFILSSSSSSLLSSSPSLKTVPTHKQMSSTNGHYSPSGLVSFFPSITITHPSIKAIFPNLTVSQCQPNYILKSAFCIKNETLIQNSNCNRFSWTTSQCVSCEDGYDMDYKGKCIARSKQSCAVAKLQQCIKCNTINGYFNAGGWCISKLIKQARDSLHFQIVSAKVMWPLMPNCKQQTQISKCSVCETGFTQVDNKCVRYDKYCNMYHELGFCVGCKSGYLLYGGICIVLNCLTSTISTELSSAYCSSCPQFHTYYSGICFPQLMSNCLTPAPVSTRSSSSMPASCSMCMSGFYLSSNPTTCRPLPLNCASIDQSTLLCAVCNAGYILINSQCTKQVYGCVKYSNDGKCTACSDHEQTSSAKYQALSNNTCAKLPFKCVRLSMKSPLICQQCQKDYQLFSNSPSTMSCVMLRPNCHAYDNTGRCSKCDTNFILHNNDCNTINNNNNTTKKITIANCKKLTDQPSMKCNICDKGYSLTNDGLACVASVANCKQYRDSGCVFCIDGYYSSASNGLCLINPANCESYSQIDGKCLRCALGYISQNGECELRTAVFNGCADNKQQTAVCLSCSSGFTLKNGLCYASHCLTYTAERNCQECPQYYRRFAADTRICQPFFCVKYSSGAKCEMYQNWYQGGYAIHSSGRISIEYCVQYSKSSPSSVLFPITSPTCLKCESNRYPSSSQSSYSMCLPYNCLNSRSYNCTQCKPGLKLDSNTGICSAQACLQFTNDGSARCKSCAKGYAVDSDHGGCISNGICVQYLGQTTCAKCAKYYNLIDGQCYPSNCDALQRIAYSKCSKCKAGFSRSSNGSCVLLNCVRQQNQSTCRTCASSYSLHSSSQICIPKHCAQYQFIDKAVRCTQCENNYQINVTDFMCHPVNCQVENELECTLCEPGYYLINKNKRNHGCVAKSCLAVDDDGICTTCSQSYQLNDITKLCQAKPVTPATIATAPEIKRINCINNSALACLKCQDGYFINDNTGGFCKPINCKSVNVKNYQCDECFEGFYKDNSRSICMDIYCETFTTDYQCLQCKKGYAISTKKVCQPFAHVCLFGQYYNQNLKKCEAILVQNCKQCHNNEPTTCIECMDGYYLNNGSCVSWVGCAKASYVDGCQECKKGLILMQGRCVEWQNLCAKWKVKSQEICQQCRIGAYLTETEQCDILPVVSLTSLKPQSINKQQRGTPILDSPSPSQTQTSSPEQLDQDEISYIDNCMFQDDIKQVCTICNSDYYITENGKCLPMPNHCTFVNDHGVCFKCEQGFVLKDRICVEDRQSQDPKKSSYDSKQLDNFGVVTQGSDNLRRST